MNSSSLVIFFTVLILVVMGATFLDIAMKSVFHDVQRHWHALLGHLNRRLDKIPNLLETGKSYGAIDEKLRQEIIELRAKSRPMEKADAEKVQLELMLSEKLGEVWKAAEKFPELQRDTNFLALKIEFKAAENEIEKYLEEYNEKVRAYNKWVNFIPLKPLMLLFRFRSLLVFEFEGEI